MRKPTETKQKLLETATRLIWQSNYDGVGVAEICKQAGVTKGTFYHYFESKADLFYESSMAYWEELREDLDRLFSPRYTPLQQLENLIQMIIYRQDDPHIEDDNPVAACPFFTSGALAGGGEEKVRQASIEMSEKALQYDIALIRNLKAIDALNGDPDVEQLARLMSQFIHGVLTYGRIFADLEMVKTDLRDGLYRILNLKEEYRVAPEDAELTVST